MRESSSEVRVETIRYVAERRQKRSSACFNAASREGGKCSRQLQRGACGGRGSMAVENVEGWRFGHGESGMVSASVDGRKMNGEVIMGGGGNLPGKWWRCREFVRFVGVRASWLCLGCGIHKSAYREMYSTYA